MSDGWERLHRTWTGTWPMSGPGGRRRRWWWPWPIRNGLWIVAAIVGAVALLWLLRDDGPELTFPVDGPARLTDSFGDPRPGGRRHQGLDIPAAKGVPVVAAADGMVAWIRDGERCCSLAIEHRDGWRTRYLHLNNDRPKSDDGRGRGILPGLIAGTTVKAGQRIGWIGDSGNAEERSAHLHFELRDPDGEAVDPYPRLKRAAERSEHSIRLGW